VSPKRSKYVVDPTTSVKKIVTFDLSVVTTLPNLSSTRTVTAGLIAAPEPHLMRDDARHGDRA
jgi:hypothetical protein